MAQAQGVDALLSEAYRELSSLKLVEAQVRLEEALALDFEDEELLYAMKCARWWADSTERIETCKDHLEAGDMTISRWKAFQDFLKRIAGSGERPALAFKHYAFGLALSRYEKMTQPGETSDPELALRMGRAYKGLGDYDAAIDQLEAAAKFRREDATALAELADVYALVDETRASKALFREAFFINPQKIDLDTIESDAMARLVVKAAESSPSQHEIVEWIPVYGELLGVFSVKRELKPIEVGKLKQSIYEMETELAAEGSRRSVLLPRLINRYFWLADHYLNRKEDKGRIDEILLKIKLLDPNVYKLYIA
ncbi:MAG: hypothetical protein E4H20_02385 [Spirochaetales bacterium]|nr:MAG: hypothetical protein E4H20_02385 [Spirochaetales bacterium]